MAKKKTRKQYVPKGPRVSPKEKMLTAIRLLLDAPDAERWMADYIVRPRRPMNVRYINSTRPRHYSGFNWLLLGLTASANDYETDYWMTYPQARALGGHVREKESATPVRFKNIYEDERTDRKTGTTEKVMKTGGGAHYVFNLAQTEDIELADIVNDYEEKESHQPMPFAGDPDTDPLTRAALALENMTDAAQIRHLDTEIPHYTPRTDRIIMPPPTSFPSPESYTLTMLHEVAHSTGHPQRLDRPGFSRMIEKNQQVPHERGLEEMTAEFAATMLAATFEIEVPNMARRASQYIRHWRAALESPEKNEGIDDAVKAAQDVMNYMLTDAAASQQMEERELETAA